MVALDLEGGCRVAKHLDLAGGVGLDPDGGIRLSGVAQQRAEIQFRSHIRILPAAGSPTPA